VIELAIDLGRGPGLPAIVPGEDGGVIAALEFGVVLPFGFQIVEVFEEQQP